jgi:hypothetical protein
MVGSRALIRLRSERINLVNEIAGVADKGKPFDFEAFRQNLTQVRQREHPACIELDSLHLAGGDRKVENSSGLEKPLKRDKSIAPTVDIDVTARARSARAREDTRANRMPRTTWDRETRCPPA